MRTQPRDNLVRPLFYYNELTASNVRKTISILDILEHMVRVLHGERRRSKNDNVGDDKRSVTIHLVLLK